MLGRDDSALPPRAAALAALATTLTAEPWALRPSLLDDIADQGLDRDQIEAAITVVAMFNYFTRVADATGIEFDYDTPLPAFEPDTCRVPTPRPATVPAPSPPAGVPDPALPAGVPAPPGLVLPAAPGLRDAWQTWRAYVLDSDSPLSRRDRTLAAAIAAEESLGWTPTVDHTPADEPLITFARQLSRAPWTMTPTNLDALRNHGYSEPAILHLLSAVAHQNATTRLHACLTQLVP